MIEHETSGGSLVDEDRSAAAPDLDDDAIRALVTRLARKHPSGGRVIERAAILAEGSSGTAILAWISAHGGEAEDLTPLATGSGLHSARLHDSRVTDSRAPLRYVLPPGALT